MNNDDFVKQLTSVTATYELVSNNARYKDLSDVEPQVLSNILSRSKAAVVRVASIDSEYYKDIEKVIAAETGRFVHLHQKVLGVIGVVYALKDDLSNGYVSKNEDPMQVAVRNNTKSAIDLTTTLKSTTKKSEKTVNNVQTTEMVKDFTKVFIVHGHDNLAKTELARFIERLGFTPIILHEQPSAGKTIIEKIEDYSNVGFGVVLYSPCDIGATMGQEKQLQPRARQNVVFEHGYLIGKLGRQRVCALVKGDIEKPKDIDGVVYVEMDARNAWQIEVAKEMKVCGYPVDMNKL
jgi:predicted nucleotide-binding protein